MAYRLESDRLNGIMEAKGLKRKDLLAWNFSPGMVDGWRQRNSSPHHRDPSAAAAVKLAVSLQVPVEYLFGAPSEYAELEYWQVAARASLHFFLNCTPEGKTISPDLHQLFERYLLGHEREAPRSAEEWSRVHNANLVAMAFADHRHETLSGTTQGIQKSVHPRRKTSTGIASPVDRSARRNPKGNA